MSKGGPDALVAEYSELQTLAMRSRRMVHEATERIDEEERGDERAREQYGGRWDRKRSRELNGGLRREISGLGSKVCSRLFYRGLDCGCSR